MTSVEPALAPSGDPPEPIGLANLAKRAFDGGDLSPLSSELIRRMIAEPDNAAVLMDLATIEHLFGNRGDALDLQRRDTRDVQTAQGLEDENAVDAVQHFGRKSGRA